MIEVVLQYLGPILWAGVRYTIPLTIGTFFIGIVIAVLVAMIQKINSSKRIVTLVKFLIRTYVWVIRGTPLLVQLFIVFFGLPKIGITLEPFAAGMIAFSLNVGAYTSETVRASIEAIPKGQWEAGYSIGMTTLQTFYRIILPQAIKISVPPLFNSFIGLVKDTSLAATITISEMFMVTQRAVAVTYEPFILYIEVAMCYLLFCTILSRTQKWIERTLEYSCDCSY